MSGPQELPNTLHRHFSAALNFLLCFGEAAVEGIKTFLFRIATIGLYVPHGGSMSQHSPPGMISWFVCGFPVRSPDGDPLRGLI